MRTAAFILSLSGFLITLLGLGAILLLLRAQNDLLRTQNDIFQLRLGRLRRRAACCRGQGGWIAPRKVARVRARVQRGRPKYLRRRRSVRRAISAHGPRDKPGPNLPFAFGVVLALLGVALLFSASVLLWAQRRVPPPPHPPPTVIAIAPDLGTTAGGTVVTITGFNFPLDAHVAFGATPAEEVAVESGTRIVAWAPPAPRPETVRVEVFAPGRSPLGSGIHMANRPMSPSVGEVTSEAVRSSPAARRPGSSALLPDDSFKYLAAPRKGTRPIIFLPGIAGSYLVNSKGHTTWPPAALVRCLPLPRRLQTTCDRRILKRIMLDEGGAGPLVMKPKYTSRRTPGTGSLNGVIDQVGVGPFRRHRYDITAQMLDADGYKQAWGRKQWQACGAGIDGYERDKCATFVSFDWRMAPTDNATWVIHVIDLVRKFTGASRVDILAHSQGGLVAEAVLHDAASVGKIYRVATLGTPYLGAPKLFGELVFRNPCQFPIVLRKCLITPAALQRTIINMPGVMALLPDKAYFDLASLAPYVDKSHDAVPVSQSFEDYRAKISSELARLGRDLALIDGELNWHQSVDDWSTHPLLDDVVRVLRMVGYDASDPAKPCRKYRCPEEALGKYTPGRGTIAAIDLRGKLLDETERSTWGLVASGDGTVPLISAAEFNAASGKDLRGGAHDMYFCGVSHQGLAQSPRVWGVVQKFFGGFNYPEDAIEQRCPYGTSGTLEGAELNPGGPG